MADSSMSGAESNIRKPESPPPPIVPQAKKLKKEASDPPPMKDQFGNSLPVFGWPFPDNEFGIELVDSMLDGHPFDSKWLRYSRSRVQQFTEVALIKAEKEQKQGNLSAGEAIGVFLREARRQIEEVYDEQEASYSAMKNEVSLIGAFYKSQHEEFFATFGEYFQSPETTQHPKLMKMLKEKLEKLKKQ